MSDDLLNRLRAAVDPVGSVTHDDPPARDAAAVLLLVDPRDPRLPLLFIRRTQLVPTHRGQIAFPGGSADVGDGGPVDTAVREGQEEMGVDPAAIDVFGLLHPVVTGTSRRRLVPVVGMERLSLEPVPDPFEVAEWFHIPIADLLVAPVTTRQILGAPDGVVVRFYEAAGRIIWGATANVLHDLLARLGRSD
jgi:8-oxo-dGTP pyrophosphatase MutT (NUDIX family)